MTGAAVDERTRADVRPQTSDGDHDRFSHRVIKEELDQSWLNGTIVTALCGKRWIPVGDPERYPPCPKCEEVYDGLPDDESQ